MKAYYIFPVLIYFLLIITSNELNVTKKVIVNKTTEENCSLIL